MTTIDASPGELALRRHHERVRSELCAQDAAWGSSGWTRRRFLAGAGMVGVAALGSQLVTTRVAYSATPSTADNTLVMVFLRGAADGLHILVPSSAETGADYLQAVRKPLLPANPIALAGATGWGLNPVMKPLYDLLWSKGQLAFVPGVSATGIERSHFQAQQFIERGGSGTATTGWLDRVLAQMGPGTTFRAVSPGAALPQSLAGEETALAMGALSDFTFPGWDDIRPQSQAAVTALYRGLEGTLGEDVPTTMAALATAGTAQKTAAANKNRQDALGYPSGAFSDSLRDLANMLRAEVGVQIATIDVGGWDTHTNEVQELDTVLASAATSLASFMSDLGPDRRSRVTVAVVTEFGRRVMINDSGGTDHGHGSLMWLLGGGLKAQGVYGQWSALNADLLNQPDVQGDVPGFNNVFDVFGELVTKRLDIGSLSTILPGHDYNPIGILTT